MSDVTEDLRILYRAVSRKQGRAIEYAGCLTAQEALRLTQLGLGKIVDVQTRDDSLNGDSGGPQPIRDAIRVPACPAGVESPETSVLLASLGRAARTNDILMFVSGTSESSHRAATVAAEAGFFCVLNILDGRGRLRELASG
jgi:hypothetical protein